MRLALVNQFGSGDASPTARLACELADALRAGGHEVDLVTSGQAYGHGRSAGPRLWREFAAHRQIAGRLARVAPVDRVVSFTSPPLLAATVQRWAERRGIPHLHACLDLYPDVAVALRALPSWGAGPFRAAMRRALARASRVVTLDEDMADALRGRYGVDAKVAPIWPPWHAAWGRRADVEKPRPATLYSGNLGRAHDWGTLLQAQELLERRGVVHDLVFQGGGAGFAPAMAAARRLGLRRVLFRDYAGEEEVLATVRSAAALVVTQREETFGLLHPSKLALARLAGPPVLFIGPAGSRAAASSSPGAAAGSLTVLPPNQPGLVADWMERHAASSPRPTPALEPTLAAITAARDQAIGQWIGLLTG